MLPSIDRFRHPLALLASVVLTTSTGFTSQDDPRIVASIARADAAAQAIVDTPAGERTFANTLTALDDLGAQFMIETTMIQFLAYVSPDSDLRDVGTAAEALVDNWSIEFGKREDIYAAVKEYAATNPQLDTLQQRMLDETMRDYRRSGMDLSGEDRARLIEIEKELAKLGTAFSKTIREDDSTVLLTADELKGVPADVVAGIERSGDLYACSLDYNTVYRPILTYCEVEATRQKMSYARRRKGGLKNIETLEEMIALRHEQATLLGYDSTAAFVTEPRMAKDPKTVQAFYDDLRPKLRVKSELDKAEYARAKQMHLGDPTAEIQSWDRSFYDDYLKRTKYAVDSTIVKEYFSMETVLAGLFDITKSLYGLEYKDVTDKSEAKGRPIWHEDVKLYEVWDKATGEMLGEFYLDLFPRDNKYGHAAKFSVEPRKRWPDGSLHLPVCALVCNFTKPTQDKPSLMSHDEVETLFHEFGHCLHSILTTADIMGYEGTHVARDFVEAPSQMFENWVWDADVLSLFAKHYETGATLPKELLDGMLSARYLGSGCNTEGQVYLGLMDFRYHTSGADVDTRAIEMEVAGQCSVFPYMEGTYFQAGFGHLVGYHAGYYGYLWSLVYASDMFSRFKEHGDILDPALGAEYRNKILAPGGTMDAMDLVRDFLGREPKADAFLEHLGLQGE